MHPKELSIKDFTYDLPVGKIARYPLPKRDESKLLTYRDGLITETVYKAIAEQLPENSLLIFNNTKVVEARLLFEKDSGSVIELFCLEPGDKYADITTAMLQKERVLWKCLVGGAKKWKSGLLQKEIVTGHGILTLSACKVSQLSDYFLIEFIWTDAQLTFAEVLHLAGVIPLPPYLNRATEEADKTTYQTIYAESDGSVAAPTAGLHFTSAIFDSFKHKNIQTDFVTLHVGAGTFKPVKADSMQGHEMHAEFFDVSTATIINIISNISHGIIAIGTTSLRTIESLYWMGVKLLSVLTTKAIEDVFVTDLTISQWDAYELGQNIAATTALQALVKWTAAKNTGRIIAKTQIIIAPGYTLRVAKALVTNFHQPQSTLLLLIAAIAGNDWKRIYEYAMNNDFRFLSYGDGSLLFAQQ